MPLFEGGYAYSRTRQSRINVGRAEQRTEAQRREVIANVSGAWSNLTASREILSVADEQVEASAIAVEGAERERGYGLRSTLDVLNAEEEARNALIARARANADAVVASYALMAATGAPHARKPRPGATSVAWRGSATHGPESDAIRTVPDYLRLRRDVS
ncbi:MAG: TolC family protein [Hyphomonadaceae bacterium]